MSECKPDAWLLMDGTIISGYSYNLRKFKEDGDIPLFTQRTWVGLTDEEHDRKCQWCAIETECKTGMAQPEQEPVAFEIWHKANHVQSLEKYGDTYKNSHVRCRHEGWLGAKETPPQRTWVGLTDEDIAECAERMEASDPTDSFWREFERAIEAKLKEKNT